MNKNKICLFVGIALMAVLVFSAVSQATLLTNGDFETGDGSGWTTGIVIVSSPAHDLYAASLVALGSASQSVSGTQGVTYTLSGDMLRSATFNKRQATLVLEFLNGTGGLISSTNIGTLTNASAGNTWFSYSNSAVAPTGTALVNVKLLLGSTGAGNSGTAYFDDVVLVPEPATVALLGLGGLFMLRRKRR